MDLMSELLEQAVLAVVEFCSVVRGSHWRASLSTLVCYVTPRQVRQGKLKFLCCFLINSLTDWWRLGLCIRPNAHVGQE